MTDKEKEFLDSLLALLVRYDIWAVRPKNYTPEDLLDGRTTLNNFKFDSESINLSFWVIVGYLIKHGRGKIGN